MAVLRGDLPSDRFTVVPNTWLRDPALSWKAKGLIAYIASHEAGYRLTTTQIQGQGKDGREAVQSGLRELEEAGYLAREEVRERGQIAGYDYIVRGHPDDGFPVYGRPGAGGADIGPPAPKNTTGEKTSTTEDEPSATPRERAKRATRLPEDFAVTEQMRSWFVENGLGAKIDGLAEHEKFLDYYRANGRTHKDWVAAWRFWMRRAADRPTRRPTGAPSGAPSGGFRTAAERSAERLAEERDLLTIAEEIVERSGGNPEDSAQVRPIFERLKAEGVNGSASRTSSTYSETGYDLDGEVVTQKEVTAGEG